MQFVANFGARVTAVSDTLSTQRRSESLQVALQQQQHLLSGKEQRQLRHTPKVLQTALARLAALAGGESGPTVAIALAQPSAPLGIAGDLAAVK